jgi:hypothetical protein
MAVCCRGVAGEQAAIAATTATAINPEATRRMLPPSTDCRRTCIFPTQDE